MFRFDSKQVGRAVTISQIGFEMVGPIVIGLLLDHYLGWSPWGVIVGAISGMVGGVWHLAVLGNKADQDDPTDQDSA